VDPTAEWRNFSHDGSGKGGQSSLARAGGEVKDYFDGLDIGVTVGG